MPIFARILLPALLFLVTLTAHASSDMSGHRSFGIFYPEKSGHHITPDKLDMLSEAGFTWLFVEEVLTDEQQIAIRDAGFSLFVMVPEYFPIPHTFSENSGDYALRSDSLLRHYRDNPSVKGFGLFAYGSWQENSVIRFLSRIIAPYSNGMQIFTLDPRTLSGDRLQPFDGTIMLTRSAAQLESHLGHAPTLSGVLYAPKNQKMDLQDIQDLLTLLDDDRDLPIFFHREWFLSNTSGHQNAQHQIDDLDLARVTSYYFRVPDARFANPSTSTDRGDTDISIILLLIFWAVFAGFYRLNPMYRKSIARFFLNYDFFVNDVLMRRTRFTNDAIILYFIISMISGLMGFTVAHIYLDSVSREALLHHTPLIPAGWSHSLIFFGIFFVITSLINAVQIAWLRIANNKHAHTYQIATLLLWPQHLNIAIITIGIILLRTINSPIIVIAMIVAACSVTLVSFFFTAYNLRRIHPTSLIYMFSTYAVYVILATTILGWLIFGMELTAAWNLASSLAQ